MNVVHREKGHNTNKKSKLNNELLWKNNKNGVRGTSLLPILSYTTKASRVSNQVPRYQFSSNNESTASTKDSPRMGPPLLPARSLKRKMLTNSISSKPESSSSGRPRPRILANDSAAVDTSFDLNTPKNRPTALRYISSSSRGGHSGLRSARSTSTAVIDPSVILAISEGRGLARGEIGMAAIDLRHPHLVICQFSDTLLYTHTLTKINFFNPVEIIVPHTFCEGVQPNQLYQMIKDQYPQINLTTVQRRQFNEAAGRQNIQTLCAPQYSAVYLQVLHKFYALTAVAAVLKYVEYIQCIVFARESLKIEYHSSENTMIIDVGTATQLELVQPLVPSAGHMCCLLGVLGPMYTVGGIRALRATILQPSCNKEFIENRLDAVQDLIDNDGGLMGDLQGVIKKLSDIDKILLLCVESTNLDIHKTGEAQLNQTLLLKTTMDMVPKLVEALKSAESGRLRKMKMDFENPHYNEITERIRNIIQEDAHVERGAMGSLQRCFAVKPNINGLLDVARRTYSELIEDIQKIVEQLSETYDLPIRLHQNAMKGFHIVLPVAPKNRRNFNTEDLPPIFIQVQNSGASVTMTTEELVVLDHQSKESLNEIQNMSNIVISSLLKDLRPFMSSLYKLCENVAELDILVALAHELQRMWLRMLVRNIFAVEQQNQIFQQDEVPAHNSRRAAEFLNTSTIGSYIRPEFSDYMDIKNSVHPLLDYNSQVMPVPNDVFASPEQNFIIITGPNMGGKSIYIKQIAIMQIMAQLGCFLPATNAVLRLCDRLYSRIGFNDSVELNASTYVYEIKEIQHIMKGLSNSSLVIIDELFRGTNEEEGTSMAWAICEELIASEAFTFFTTHFTYLTRLQELYFNVVNLRAAVTEEDLDCTESTRKRIVYKHKIESGSSHIKKYGLALAAKTHLPEDIVNLAMELSELITDNEKVQAVKTSQQSDEAALYKLYADVKLVFRRHNNAHEISTQIIQTFKRNNPSLIERIKDYKNSNQTDDSANCFPVNESSNDLLKNNVTGTDDGINSIEALPNARCLSINPLPYSNCIVQNDYTSVKSSTELLNRIMGGNEDSNIEKCVTVDDRENQTRRSCQDDVTNHTELVQNCSTALEGIELETSKYSDSNHHDPTKSSDDMDIIENMDTDSGINHFNSCSSIAEALTQIIEEYSMEKSQTNISFGSNSMTSLDDDFISETVNEINEELNGNLNELNIILTPPMGFRDN